MISKRPTLYQQFGRVMPEWQINRQSQIVLDERQDQQLIIVDFDVSMAFNDTQVLSLRQQFCGPLIAMCEPPLTNNLIDKLFVQYHFDEVLLPSMSDREIRARMQQKDWRLSQVMATPDQNMVVGDLKVDLQHYSLTVSGRPLKIGPIDFRLLVYFMNHVNVVVTRLQIAEGVWHNRRDATMRAIDSHISQLRKLIEEDVSAPQYLQTVRGFGYIFQDH